MSICSYDLFGMFGLMEGVQDIGVMYNCEVTRMRLHFTLGFLSATTPDGAEALVARVLSITKNL
jgi:hypothetical protein